MEGFLRKNRFFAHTAGYPIILTILDLWVRRVTIVGFLDLFTMGKWVFPS